MSEPSSSLGPPATPVRAERSRWLGVTAAGLLVAAWTRHERARRRDLQRARRERLEAVSAATALRHEAAEQASARRRAEQAAGEARAAVTQAAERLHRLQALTAELALALTEREVARVIVEQGVSSLAADAGALVLLDEATETLEIVDSVGLRPPLAAQWRRLPLRAQTPLGDVTRSADPVFLESREEVAVAYPHLLPVQEELGDSAWAVIPLIGSGPPLGALALSFADARRFESEDRRFMVALAGLCAQALERTTIYEREHEKTEALQRSLLPERLPEVLGVESAARYVAAAEAELGGDWYDLVPLPGGKVGLAIGDVVGRGIRAAATMGHLRTAMRAYALEDPAPSSVLERLDRLAQSLGQAMMATALFAVLEPATALVRFASAGHPAPLVLEADGQAIFREEARSVPLGVVGDAEFVESEFTLTPGATLILYTDGLVEERGMSMDEGLDRLRTGVAIAPQAVDRLLDHLLSNLFPYAPATDDVAVMAVRLAPLPAERLEMVVPAEPASLAVVRDATRRWLTQNGIEGTALQDILVASGEACANGIEHAYGGGVGMLEVEVRREGDGVLVRVRDFGSWREPRGEGRGLGLQLMAALVDRIEMRRGGRGTEVELRWTREPQPAA